MTFISDREDVRAFASGFISVSDAARMLGIGEGMVRYLADTGRLPNIRYGDRKRIRAFHRDDVRQVAEHRQCLAAMVEYAHKSSRRIA